MRLFPLDFRRNLPVGRGARPPEPLEQRCFREWLVPSTGTCLSFVLNPVSTNAVWGYSLLSVSNQIEAQRSGFDLERRNDRQVSSQRQDCRFCGWQTPQGFHAKRHGRWGAHHVQSDLSCLCSQQLFFSSAPVIYSFFDNVREQRWAILPRISRRSASLTPPETCSALNTLSVYQAGPTLHRWRASTRKQASGQTTP